MKRKRIDEMANNVEEKSCSILISTEFAQQIESIFNGSW